MTDFVAIQTQTGWGRVLQSFGQWCDPQPGWLTLDVGCGPGLLPALLARRGCRSVGADLDGAMLRPQPLHRVLVQADALRLPFPSQTFHLVTASNLLFLLPEPLPALQEMKRLVRQGGQVALLNPSERLTVEAAERLAGERGLEGVARQSLVNWARRAETNRRWSEAELRDLLAAAGLIPTEIELRVGPGLARFARGIYE